MSSAIALGITVVAAIAYTAASVWAARRQTKWVDDVNEEFKNGKL